MTDGPLAGPPETAPDLSVIVVTYNSRDLVEAAIASAEAAAAAAGLRVETIVVDNASSDGTAASLAHRRPPVRVVPNERNVGFGAANNRAFEVATGRWWLLLNPDATIDVQALEPLVRALEADARLAAVGPAIRGAGLGTAESAGMLPGLRSLAGHFLLLNRLLPGDRGGPWRGWQLRARDGGPPRDVEWLSGAAMLVRPEAIRAVGGFDPGIFLYAEDTDLGRRLRDGGWRLELVPEARASHAIGGSQSVTAVGWVRGLDRDLRRRGRSAPALAVCLSLVALGLAARAIAGSANPSLRRSGQVRRLRAGAREAARLALSGESPAVER